GNDVANHVDVSDLLSHDDTIRVLEGSRRFDRRLRRLDDHWEGVGVKQSQEVVELVSKLRRGDIENLVEQVGPIQPARSQISAPVSQPSETHGFRQLGFALTE